MSLPRLLLVFFLLCFGCSTEEDPPESPTTLEDPSECSLDDLSQCPAAEGGLLVSCLKAQCATRCPVKMVRCDQGCCTPSPVMPQDWIGDMTKNNRGGSGRHSEQFIFSPTGAPLVTHVHEGTLYLMERADDTWRSQEIARLSDSSTSQVEEFYTSLATDTSGHPYVGYSKEQEVVVSWRLTDGTWMSEVVGAATSRKPHVTLRIDASDRLHLTYHDEREALVYATRLQESKSWRTTKLMEPVADERGIFILNALNSNMEVDDKGDVHVIFVDPADNRVGYLTNAKGNEWENEWITPRNEVSQEQRPSLSITKEGELHLLAPSNATSNKHYYQKEGAWVQGERVGAFSASLIVSDDGVLHLIGTKFSRSPVVNSRLTYGRWDGTTWSFSESPVLTYVVHNLRARIQQPTSGQVHLYYTIGNLPPQYALILDDMWSIKNVPDQGLVTNK